MKTIRVAQEISNNVVTRSSWSAILQKIESSKEKSIIIDFDRVEFVSRSAADEYLKLKAKTSKTLLDKNQTTDVKKMFTLTEKISEPKVHQFKFGAIESI